MHVASGQTSSIVGAFSAPFYDAWLTPDNQTVVTATAHSVDLWDLTTGIGEFGVRRDSGSGVGLVPDGTAFAVGETSIMLYDVHTLIPRRPLRSSGRADFISFDANGTHLAWMTDRNGAPRLHIRDLVDENIPIARIPLEAAQGFVPMLAFSPTGDTIAAVHGNGNLTVWNIDTISPLVQIPLPDTNYQRLAYAPGGKSIAFSAGSLPIRVIDIDAGTDEILADIGYLVLGMTYSPDGTVLALSGIDSVLLLDASSGEILGILDTLHPYVEQIRFSSEGNYLISAGSDGAVRLWGIPIEP
jgi:WD40 repeat protein